MLDEVGSTPIGSLVQFSEEKWDKSDGRFTDVFPYIEISGVGLGTIEYKASQVLVVKAPSRARQIVRANDVLVSLTRPHRGAVAEVLSEHNGVVASTGFAILRDMDAQLRRRFLTLCLVASFGRDQMMMRSSGGSYPAITKEELAKVLIPNVTLGMQENLIAEMDAARAERKSKLAQADALLIGIDNFVLEALGIAPPDDDTRREFAVRRGDMSGRQFSPSHHTPEMRRFLDTLRSHPATSKPLREYVEINPKKDITGLNDSAKVGFIPMPAVSDGATGEYKVTERPLKEVSKGFTYFRDGDVLWAKITPCMQNGKSCIVEGLPNAIGFGSTEFHVLRVKYAGVSREFVKEFVSQKSLRQMATNTFTGTAGQQRVPAAFLADLPFPEISEAQQSEIVSAIRESRQQSRRLRAEADSIWQEAKRRFEERMLGSAS